MAEVNSSVALSMRAGRSTLSMLAVEQRLNFGGPTGINRYATFMHDMVPSVLQSFTLDVAEQKVQSKAHMNIACLISDALVLEQVRTTLELAQLVCSFHASENALSRALQDHGADLVLLDFACAPESEDSALAWLQRRHGDLTPVLALCGAASAQAAALLLNAGADAVLARPFAPAELVVRTQVLTRRGARNNNTPNHPRSRLELGGFTLDRNAGQLAYDGDAIALTPREFSMAWMFFSSPGVYISRETIGASLWSTDSEVASRTIEQHVYKLRKKLLLGTERGVMIRTAYSQGYRLELIDDSRT